MNKSPSFTKSEEGDIDDDPPTKPMIIPEIFQ